MVPVGASFSDRGMRNDQHDAVAAQLMIPIRQILRGNVPPAAGGAPQPAETASHAEQHISRAAGGGPQPAEAPSDAEQPTSPAAVAVAPQLMTPIRRIWKAHAPPAAGGAPQRAKAASHAEHHISPAADGGPQSADAPSDAEQPISPDWEATNAQQDTLVQGVSRGHLCAVSINKTQGEARGGVPTIIFDDSRFHPFAQNPPSKLSVHA